MLDLIDILVALRFTRAVLLPICCHIVELTQLNGAGSRS